MAVAKKTVELFYDVVSPYTWIAFESLCRYRNKWNIDLQLKPFFLGGVMQGSDNRPPGMVPNKGIYMMKDLDRLTKYYQMPFKHPSDPGEVVFKKGSLAAMRFITGVNMKLPQYTEAVSREIWMRIYTRDQDITEMESLAQAGRSAGLTEAQVKDILANLKSQEVKDTLKKTTEEALEHGAFGSPTIVAHDAQDNPHMVFGSDRMHIVAQILDEKYEGPLNEFASKL